MPVIKRRPGAAPATTRAEIIANYAQQVAAPAPAPAADATADAYQPEPYAAEPDETVACPSCECMNAPDASYCDQCGFKLAGSTDVVETAVVTAAAPVAPAPTPDQEKAAVAPDAICQNEDCGHSGVEHLDDSEMGDNTGACTVASCECLGMQPEPAPNTGTGDKGAPVASDALAEAAPAGGPGSPVGGSEPQTGLNAPPDGAELDGGLNMGPAFSIPVGVIEGQPTGDGRQIAPDALTWRVPPLPLMLLKTETHDPDGWDQNLPAVLCGRIDSLERVAGEGSTQIVSATGFLLPTDDGQEAAEIIEAMKRVGVSADIAVVASEIAITETDEMGMPMAMESTTTEGVILGFTICPYAAFEGAYITLGDGDVPEAMPMTDDPATATMPAIVAAGGQLIHWTTFEDCGCDLGEVLVAAGGPVAPPAAWFADPGFDVDDGRVVEIHNRRGASYACPLTVTDDGEVFGHVAPWEVCHIGQPGCITAPRTATGYAYFLRGQHVVCADGSSVRTGVLTADAGHAELDGTPGMAMAHYDHSGFAAADVAIGEDAFGIWVHGRVRPEATDAQVAALRAGSVSGDWRKIGDSMELVAALAVNVPGFPIAQVRGAQMSMVAAGARLMAHLKAEPASEGSGLDDWMHGELRVLAAERVAARARDRIERLRG